MLRLLLLLLLLLLSLLLLRLLLRLLLLLLLCSSCSSCSLRLRLRSLQGAAGGLLGCELRRLRLLAGQLCAAQLGRPCASAPRRLLQALCPVGMVARLLHDAGHSAWNRRRRRAEIEPRLQQI